ncbi:MAG: hypothetical protein P1P88_14530 [Bacteroidales bacterium]|nr:hypothetical protein [Bacteroidales bacterium]
MRTLFLAFILFFKVTLFTNAQTSINSILILGDSNLKGHFGAFLQKEIHDSCKVDVLSIAIGGAGSKTFLPPMKNSCCGYRVRQSNTNIELEKAKKNTEIKIPILEKSEKATNCTVMGQYEGNLLSIMNVYKPLAVILVLGTNYLNAHDELLALIKSYDNNIPIVWIGPFDKKTSTGRYTLIKEALKNQTNCMLVPSDSIVDKLGLTPDHFYGTEAKKLAKVISAQFRPFLDISINQNNQWNSYRMLFYPPEYLSPKKARKVSNLKAEHKKRDNIKWMTQ